MNRELPCPVLVVDDDRLVSWSLQRALRREGYEVAVLECAESGLARVEMGGFDLAIVDLVIPRMDGLWLIPRLRSLCPGIETIVITCEGSPEIARKALELGALAYVENPFSIKELSGLVKSVLPCPTA